MPYPTSDHRLLTVAEACEHLRISRGTLYQLFRRGDLASLKVAGRRRIPEAALAAFVADRTTCGGAA